MVQVDLDNLPFNPSIIWKQVLVRYARAVNSSSYLAQTVILRTISRGDSTTSAPIKHLRKHLHPLSHLDNLGRLKWSRAMRAEFNNHNVTINAPNLENDKE
jgi:hypothetical protein